MLLSNGVLIFRILGLYFSTTVKNENKKSLNLAGPLMSKEPKVFRILTKNYKLFITDIVNTEIQARIAQLVADRLCTGEVPGSNPGKSENFSVKISNWIVRI